ncbi:transcriptional repressor, CopY family [Catenulispora acidiphila DSM 44928]|uniref:Transcriptional repressor, CopY family n=1 Tax=Catenulispora acidiphila (strain DSM 44928 / JCM 14897 / NBRC 102108 / NRRL B-24433 / ID139908) TaxID=479433 RepID=C7QJB6_CATAD|nr:MULTISPECIES: BlaI/MecI/CopY family transcriptional regulator [Catenulispora]ACU69258.1 transcriptional repressor, CopY family [Catenulispora acidiphila DSM 44928]
MANERAGGPPRLGELERAVMDVLWNAPDGSTAQEIVERLAARDGTAELAATTVLTVLDRLRRKDFVERERVGRAHRYRAARTRDDVIAASMLAVLETTDDRRSALVRFAGSVSAEEAALLREALAGLEE